MIITSMSSVYRKLDTIKQQSKFCSKCQLFTAIRHKSSRGKLANITFFLLISYLILSTSFLCTEIFIATLYLFNTKFVEMQRLFSTVIKVVHDFSFFLFLLFWNIASTKRRSCWNKIVVEILELLSYNLF